MSPDSTTANPGGPADTAGGVLIPRLSGLLFFCALAVLAGTRWFQPALDRPLDYDEWHTLEFYGWPGLTPAGDMKWIRRAADFEALPRPSVRQLGLGVFRALGVWKEPNNQVPHSLLVNLATALERTPRAVRAPAFAGAVLFAILVFLLCGPVMKWHWGAPIAGLCAAILPYVTEYSMNARGYSLMLTLVMLLLLLAVRLTARPQRIWLSVLMVVVATASIFNVISLAVDWILPAYAALAVSPPGPVGGTWKRILGVQGLAIAGLCGVFAIDRLPALALASQRFGETIGSIGEFADWVGKTGAYLFPGPAWALFGIAGVAGLAVMSTRPNARFFGALVLAMLLLNGLHFVLSRRCPYSRTCGYCLVPVLIGFAFLVEQLIRRIGGTPRLAVWLTLVAGGTGLVTIGGARAGVSPEITGNAPSPSLPESGVYAVMQEHDYAAAKFLPERWTTWQDRPVTEDIHYLALAAKWRERGVSAAAAAPSAAGTATSDPESAVSVFPARAWAFSPESDLPEARLVVATWYPDQERLGMDPAPLTELIERYSVVSVRRTARLQANYDYYLRPYAFEFVAEGTAARGQVRDLLNDALRRFGGAAVVVQTLESGESL